MNKLVFIIIIILPAMLFAQAKNSKPVLSAGSAILIPAH